MLLILIHFKYVVNKLVTENNILIYFNMFYFILFYFIIFVVILLVNVANAVIIDVATT